MALTLFVAAYLAEVVRGGLHAVPVGQYEAAKALGLSYWQTIRLVVLPQALRAVIPSLVNLAIGIFQDTTLVIIIGMFDFLNTARVSATDPNWLGFYREAYVFAALVYFIVCFCASRYSLWLEARLAAGSGCGSAARAIPQFLGSRTCSRRWFIALSLREPLPTSLDNTLAARRIYRRRRKCPAAIPQSICRRFRRRFLWWHHGADRCEFRDRRGHGLPGHHSHRDGKCICCPSRTSC